MLDPNVEESFRYMYKIAWLDGLTQIEDEDQAVEMVRAFYALKRLVNEDVT